MSPRASSGREGCGPAAPLARSVCGGGGLAAGWTGLIDGAAGIAAKVRRGEVLQRRRDARHVVVHRVRRALAARAAAGGGGGLDGGAGLGAARVAAVDLDVVQQPHKEWPHTRRRSAAADVEVHEMPKERRDGGLQKKGVARC